MKKLILSLTLAGAAALAAKAVSTVASANTFGVLKVESDAKETIIAVPWVEVGIAEANPIAVANLVMTSNLTVGDKLYYYNSDTKTYLTWQLVESANAKSWDPLNSVIVSGEVQSGIHAGVQQAPRGSALILERQNPKSNNDAVPIYLYGQYVSGTTNTTITANSWNLIAPPTATDFVVSSENSSTTCMTGTPATGDYIVLGSNTAKKFKYKDGKWIWTSKALDVQVPNEYLTIPAGTGAWYVSVAASYAENQAPTFTW